MKCFPGRYLYDPCLLEMWGHFLEATTKTAFPIKIFLDTFGVLNAAGTQMSGPLPLLYTKS